MKIDDEWIVLVLNGNEMEMNLSGGHNHPHWDEYFNQYEL